MKSNKTKLGGLLYRVVYKGWRSVPESVRQAVYSSSLLNRTKALTRDAAGFFAPRDDIYNRDYYALVDAMAKRSVPVMADSIVQAFAPGSAVDVGCGTGTLLAALRERGLRTLGYEYSQVALGICRSRGLEVIPFDLTHDSATAVGSFDVAISTEVAEHLDARFADRLVDFLVGCSGKIIFTAATPGQGGGIDHVNEQPHAYWIAKFGERNYSYDAPLADRWRTDWRKAGIEACYHRNVMVFRAAPP